MRKREEANQCVLEGSSVYLLQVDHKMRVEFLIRDDSIVVIVEECLKSKHIENLAPSSMRHSSLTRKFLNLGVLASGESLYTMI